MSRILPILTLAVLVLPTASRGQTPPGDHYLCYKASQSKGETPLQTTAKLLVDQLQDQSYDVKKVVSLCNPATKTHNGVTTSPQFPAVHQQGYQIKLPKGAAKFVPSNHTVFDQFGSLQLTVKSPDSLLVRTAKTVLGSTLTSCKLDSGCSAGLSCIGGACIDPAFPTPPADNVGVDNFECYKVAIQKGTPKFQPIVGGLVQVTDQFGGPLKVEITKPTKICTPVDKAGENPGAETHPGHLMCYQVKLTKTDPAQPKFAKTRVAVANTNFPDTRLDAKSIAELCVPAFKDVVPTPSPTATPSPTPTVCSACPADYWDVDGNPLTGTCGCEYHCHQTSTSSDPIDPNFTDDNCDGSDGVTAQCVYVSTGQGDDNSGTGTRQSPLKTIAAAIQKAQASAVAGVCLSGEVYNESVAMVSGVSVYGGFDQNDADFKFRRSASVTTTVNAPGVVFDAPQIDQETHIEGITINAQAAAPAGASTYGVRLSGGTGQLFVRYNVIQAAAGNGGDAGVDGSANPSAQAAAGNNGQDGCTSCSTNGAGGPPPSCTEFGGKGGNGGFDSGNGAAGSPGSGSASGGSAGISSGMCSTFGAPKSGPGGPGSTGSGGAQGTPGSGGAALGSVSAGYEPAVGTGGLAGDNGKGGGGGGGGGGGAANLCNFGICANTCNADKGGGGGSGGCGGLGGDRGLGGGGGGGSFGVFAATGTIAVTSNDITTHNGGNGGKGGNGAAGQSGGAGGTGGAAADDAGAGGDGRSGGTGGAGGPGGGGGGGPSACLGYASSVVLTFSTNTCTGGLPGSGGDGGTNPTGGVASAGQAGVASSSLQIN